MLRQWAVRTRDVLLPAPVAAVQEELVALQGSGQLSGGGSAARLALQQQQAGAAGGRECIQRLVLPCPAMLLRKAGS
jgi:hypothetical protein